MFSEDYEEVRMQEKISTIAARGCVERWLIQVCDHNIFTGTKFESNIQRYATCLEVIGRRTNVDICKA